MEKEEKRKKEKFKWYVLQCIPSHENSTVENLKQKFSQYGLDGWVNTIEIPKEKTFTVDKKGKRVTKEKIMLPGYILINMDISNGELLPNIKVTKGVVGWLNPSSGRISQRPEVMRKSEVERFLKIKDEKEDEFEFNFIVGENVKLTSGSFAGFEGTIDKLDDKKQKMDVIVKVFGRDMPVNIEYLQVTKV